MQSNQHRKTFKTSFMKFHKNFMKLHSKHRAAHRQAHRVQDMTQMHRHKAAIRNILTLTIPKLMTTKS